MTYKIPTELLLIRNQEAIDELMKITDNIEQEIEQIMNSSSITQSDKNHSIELQKKWMRIRQTLLYLLQAMNNNTLYTPSIIMNYNDAIDNMIEIFGEGGDNLLQNYYYNYPVWEQLKN